LQPIRRNDGELIQRRAHGFADAFKPVEPAHRRQYVR
jgi:hypothetical protein